MIQGPTGPLDVIIAAGDTRAGLSIARSLSRRRVQLLVTGEHPSNIVFKSRYVRYGIKTPSPAMEPEGFIDVLLRAVRDHHIRLVIPVTDAALQAISERRGRFPAETKLAMPSPDAIVDVLDKRRNLEIAESIGIPCPKRVELEDVGNTESMIESLGLPVVVKNPGHISGGSQFRILYAHSDAELQEHVGRAQSQGVRPLFQEHVSGSVYNLCCFVVRGRTVAIHPYQSHRRTGGTGVLREILAPMPELEALARDLLETLEWDGVAHVAFFVSLSGEKIWYMETNGRFWASVEGSVRAGWDFPYWTYRYFLHGEEPRPKPIRVGDRTCWHAGDLRALVTYLKGGEAPETGTEPGKLKAMLDFVSGFRPDIHPETFRFQDPIPAAHEYARYFSSLLRRSE